MRFNDFNIVESDYGYIIRDKYNRFILEVSTEDEAEEYIENYIDNYNKKEITKKEVDIDIEKIFINYCSRLPNVRYPDDCVLETTNEQALNRFIDSFKKSYNVEISKGTKTRGDETYFVVYDIEIIRE